MNPELAQIALMFVIPLGVTFIAILQAASSETTSQKIAGAFFSFVIVILDCLFYFSKNSFIAYNNDGGLLLIFFSLFLLGIFLAIKSETAPQKFSNIFLAVLFLLGIVGISYQDRPTLIITSPYTAEDIAKQKAFYQDYISSFQNSSEKTPLSKNTSSKEGSNIALPQKPTTLSEGAKARLDSYMEESRKIMKRMKDVETSINNFGTLPSDISEKDREEKSRQALAISNNAVAINKKTLGLFHPHESSEAHSEFIQSTESLRLAAYSLYSYTLQENSADGEAQLKQSREQLTQSKIYLERFINAIQALLLNYKNQQDEKVHHDS